MSHLVKFMFTQACRCCAYRYLWRLGDPKLNISIHFIETFFVCCLLLTTEVDAAYRQREAALEAYRQELEGKQQDQRRRRKVTSAVPTPTA